MSRGLTSTSNSPSAVDSASIWAVVPAAGSGIRLRNLAGRTPKALYAPVSGEPCLLELSVAALQAPGFVDGIVAAVRAQDVQSSAEMLSPYESKCAIRVVPGGDSRQQSVYRALRHIPDHCDIVLVHDAARPFCRPDEVRAVCEAALEHSAALLARQVASTLKRSDENGCVEITVSREGLWEAQTPQVFKRALLLEAYEAAEREGFLGTDDSQLIERLGHKVHLVSGSVCNFKVTHPDDIELAQALMQAR